MSLVEPRLSRGLRDLLPEDTLARQAMIDVVRGVYELYGFVPLITPAPVTVAGTFCPRSKEKFCRTACSKGLE